MKQNGMTLIELMVALAIGLGITLAISSVVISSENHKRITTSTNDAQQTGVYGYYALDKALRSAGSAIAMSVRAYPNDAGVLGCHLNAGGIFPRTVAFPSPFAAFLGGAAGTLNVAPVLIGQNQSLGGSDVIMVMSGSGSAGGVSRQITGGGSSTSAILDNAVGMAHDDLLLVSQNGQPECLMEEIDTTATPTVNLAGTYYTATASGIDMATLAGSTSTYVTPIGNADANNVQFTLFGVDDKRTLYSYDMLQHLKLFSAGTDASEAIADGVIQMNAIYGVSSTGSGVQDEWISPGDTNWHVADVMASPSKMQQIVSVRVALVVRGEYYDRNPSATLPINPVTTGLTLFNGLKRGIGGGGASLAIPITFAGDDQQFRYRVFEFTVPLRNMLIVAGGP
jgi:type IV pilus assembly protein PilW